MSFTFFSCRIFKLVKDADTIFFVQVKLIVFRVLYRVGIWE